MTKLNVDARAQGRNGSETGIPVSFRRGVEQFESFVGCLPEDWEWLERADPVRGGEFGSPTHA